MPFLRLVSSAEQVAAHLREGLLRGDWSGGMPGVNWLAADLGINHKTAEAALRLLEQEGLLVPQGPGRRRRIAPPAAGGAGRRLRVALLLWDVTDRSLKHIVDLQHRLTEAGHIPIAPPRTLMELKMDVGRVARMVKQTAADVWVVTAGSLDVLKWFALQNAPVMALSGRGQELPIAAVRMDMRPAIFEATQNLVQLGHRRIVMLLRRQHRLPKPGYNPVAFLDALKANGIQTSPYSLPDWDESAEGFQECLAALFRFTPPTALLLDEALFFSAALLFLTARNLRVPQDVSLICCEPDPSQAWCVSSMAHIHLDHTQAVRSVMRWLDNVARGKKDVRQTIIKARYYPGGTVHGAVTLSRAKLP